MDASPNPNRTRNRRSERYREESGVAPSEQLLQRSELKPYYEPTPPPVYEDEPVRTRRPRQAAPMMDAVGAAAPVGGSAVAEEPRKRMPGWLIASLVVTLLLVLALIAAQALMMAYLKRQEDARTQAHEELLSYYHIQEFDGAPSRITYQDLIEYYAGLYNLHPAYVAAIIRNESSFRTDAESGAGARGLMQLMPDTAAWIAGKLGVTSYSFDDMYDAEMNIRFGTWYLGYLSDLFRGDPVLVTAAYHAGQTTVTQWLSNRSMSPDGITIPLENLMDGPTKTYAGRVTQSYGIYQALLYPDQPLPQDVVPVDGADAPDAAPTSFIQR